MRRIDVRREDGRTGGLSYRGTASGGSRVPALQAGGSDSYRLAHTKARQGGGCPITGA
ncbi:hypothetical protein ABZV34_35045 [Streptomyces sp. NPDC005195]|uniref:hypothetical protein n=1 Tax=Streptomyces sp. NPDC005195 TaxID=3154561 RepID=UPI0033B72C48